MDTLAIRQELHEYIETADDKKVEAIYTILKGDVGGPYEWWNDEELVIELDRRSADLESGKDKGFTLEESMARLKDKSKRNGL